MPASGCVGSPTAGQSPGAIDTGGEMSEERWEVGPVLSRAWELLKRHVGVIVGAMVILVLTQTLFTGINRVLGDMADATEWTVALQLLGLAALLVTLAGWAVNTLLTLGCIRIYLDAVRGEQPRIGQLLGEGRQLVPGMIASLITAVGVLLGSLLLIVPGVILFVGWMFSLVALGDRREGALEAIRVSWRMTDGERGGLLLWVLVCFGLMLAGVLTCGVGVFLAAPICGLGTVLI